MYYNYIIIILNYIATVVFGHTVVFQGSMVDKRLLASRADTHDPETFAETSMVTFSNW